VSEVRAVSSYTTLLATYHCTNRTTMVVKIRLARFGRVNEPFYNIVVAHAR